MGENELLTMDSTEALELGFSKLTAASIPDMLHQMGIEKFTIIRINESWSETMVRFIGTISPILIMIGLAGLYMELKAPGIGLPGIIGVACLAVVFFNQYMVGLADYTELLILLFGLVLMGVEIFVIPGFGIAGFAAILCITVGMILSFQNFVIPDPSIPWEADVLTHNIMVVVGSWVVAVLLGLFFIGFILPRLSKGREGPFLTTDLKEAHADSSETAKGEVRRSRASR